MNRKIVPLIGLCLYSFVCNAQESYKEASLKRGNSEYYANPIMHLDFSDPDVCRVGDDFWFTASSFSSVPGLPILHSKDLVNWQIVNYALPKLQPSALFNSAQPGKGVWAPCIRYHAGTYFIYWGDPDLGIYCIQTSDPRSTWSEPVLVKSGKGFIDPTPFWDEDGKAYLMHAYAASRTGINSILVLQELSSDGTSVKGNPSIVFDGNDGVNHTCEGPKLYKRNGYYYVFCPAGGVEKGWQLVLRSHSIHGPYESRIVMAQGNSSINGPHQGAWVDTPKGESWFIHFQDKGLYGRVIHLNPMKWLNDWPVIGEDKDGDGCGEPMLTAKKPDIIPSDSVAKMTFSDEFNTSTLGLQWQWQANYQDAFGFPSTNGFYRLYAYRQQLKNLWLAPNLLLQKFMAESFVATSKLSFASKDENERIGLLVMGSDYSALTLRRKGKTFLLEQALCKEADKGNPEKYKEIAKFAPDRLIEGGLVPALVKEIYLRVEAKEGGSCYFSYSFDGAKFTEVGVTFQAQKGRWIGAKVGCFASGPNLKGGGGWVDIDWFHITSTSLSK